MEEKENVQEQERFTAFVEGIRKKAMRHGERAEWFRSFGQHRLEEIEMERKRFLFDLHDYCMELGTLPACVYFFYTEGQNLAAKAHDLTGMGVAHGLSREDIEHYWIIRRLGYLANSLCEDVDPCDAGYPVYIQKSSEGIDFWI